MHIHGRTVVTGNKRQHGFTLIELMITVAIVGLLATIAYPSYLENIRKARRADAQAALIGMAAAMERFMVNSNGSYANAAGSGATLPAAATFYPAQVPIDGGAATYSLRITALTGNSYTLSAIPTGAQTGDRCGTLTLTADGAQGIGSDAKSGVQARDCWRS